MSKSDRERGSVLVTVALTLVVLFSFLALAIDVGVGYVERRKIQAVADAAALAGAAVLTDNGTDAQILAAVNDYVRVQNPLAANERSRTHTTQWLNYMTPVGTVGIGARPAAATGILVTVTGHVRTVFANVFGISELSASAQGGGGFSPLDVMVVLDKSGSMDDDSCLLKGITSPNPIKLATYFKTTNQCASLAPAPYYRIDSANCVSCKGTWKTSPNRCTWPDGATMGSEVNTICGLVQTSSTACAACKGVWVTPPVQPLTDLQTAAKGFVDLVQAQLGPTDPHMGLISYSDSAILDQSLTPTLSSVKTKIGNIIAGGNTNCEDGMYKARLELTTSGRQRWTAAKVILFMSDGQANQCRAGSTCTPTAKQLAITEATRAGALGIQVYTIGLGVNADADMLQQMATLTGGAYQYAATGTDLGPAFATLFQKIKRLRLVQ